MDYFDIQDKCFTLEDTSFSVGDVFVSREIYFSKVDSVQTLAIDHSPVLDTILGFLLKNKNLVIEISGHTDNRCKDTFNEICGSREATLVRNFFVRGGVRPERLFSAGFSNHFPVISEEEIVKMKDPVERQKAYDLNNRIEFRIIRIEEDEGGSE